jgi:hypothetical protein
MPTITVDTLIDENDGNISAGHMSLREAIAAAADGDTIAFSNTLAGGTIVLTAGELALIQDVTINGDVDGDHKADITISGDANGSGTTNAGDSRIFNINSGAQVTLASLTLTHGFTTGSGGAVSVSGGLTLVDSTISHSHASGYGGGLVTKSGSTLVVANSTFFGNDAQYGGAIDAAGTGTNATLINTTLYDNTATKLGGGVEVAGTAVLLVQSSTITHNHAGVAGGGLDAFGSGYATVYNSIVVGNGAPNKHDLYVHDATSHILAGFSYLGSGDNDVTDISGSNNRLGTVGLGPLADNGGPVQTLALLGGGDWANPAVRPLDTLDLDHDGDATEPLPVDANGAPRIINGVFNVGASQASLLTVTTADDSGADSVVGSLAQDMADGDGLSLREAIAHSSADGIIEFAAGLAGQTITLKAGELALTQDITIDGDTDGDRRADITISGDANGSGTANAGDSRIFNISGGAQVTLASLTLTQGYSAADGGAVYASGNSTLTLVDSTISNSVANNLGGGLDANYASVDIVNSTISGNSAEGYGGGGLYLRVGNFTLTNATVSGNSANNGGGISTAYATLTVQSSTIADNHASVSSGGLDVFKSSATVINSVIAGNSAVTSGSADIRDTGAAASTLAADHSFFGTTVTITTDNGGNINNGGNAGLGALADNGGPVQTHAILAGSQLINAGSATSLPADTVDLDGNANRGEPLPVDANGNVRVFDGALDIGASETSVLTVTSADDTGDDASIGTLAADMADGGGLSLREAIAHSLKGGTVLFDAALAGQTITLKAGELALAQSITIDGDINGDHKADITISGDANNNGVGDAGDSRIFGIYGGTATLGGLTLTQGYSPGYGGAVYFVNGVALTLVDSTVSDSHAAYGGGGLLVAMIGDAAASITIVNSTISDNTTDEAGGGLLGTTRDGGAITIAAENSTFSNNTASGGGGGLLVETNTSTTLTNTTIYGNSAHYAGGIEAASATSLTIQSSTISKNDATLGAGGVYVFRSNATIINSVIAGNTAGTTGDDLLLDKNGIATLTADHSFFGTTVTITTDSGGNINNGGDAGLGALADNGGPVQTQLILVGSQLINAGNGAVLPVDTTDLDGDSNKTELLPVDANGNARVVGSAVDIGAVEQVANRAPTSIALSNDAIAENSAAGTVVGTLSATDPDAGDTETFSIVDASGTFAIAGNTIVIAAGKVLDFETKNSYSVDVTATDAGGLTKTQTFTINVGDVNEAPTDVALSTNTIAENSAAGTVVGTLSATDLDAGDAQTFSITDPTSTFAIAGNTIVLAAGKSLDFETKASYSVDVTVTDAGGLTHTKTFTIDITDVLEPIVGTPKNDKLHGTANHDIILGVGGNDILDGKGGGDTLNGGKGFDKASYASAQEGVIVNLAKPAANTGDAHGDKFINVEAVVGSKFADTLIGNRKANTLDGGKGDDTLTGGGASDHFVFGKTYGKDTITDFHAKGSHHDVVDLSHAAGIDNFKALIKHHIEDTGNDVTITASDGSTLVLAHVDSVADLSKGDFLF